MQLEYAHLDSDA